jgi:hypothetical protein
VRISPIATPGPTPRALTTGSVTPTSSLEG